MSSIEKFNQLLRQELTIVQVYTSVLKAAPALACFNQLVDSLHCHQARADLIAGEIRQLKGRPGWLTEAPRLDLSVGPVEQEVLYILAEHEDATSSSYNSLLYDSDFVVQLLAKRLHSKQLATKDLVAAYSQEARKVA